MTRLARLAAASTAFAITFVIFHAVVSLSEPASASASVRIAAASPAIVSR